MYVCAIYEVKLGDPSSLLLLNSVFLELLENYLVYTQIKKSLQSKAYWQYYQETGDKLI